MLLKRESKCWWSVVTQLASTNDFAKRIQTDEGVTGWCHPYRPKTCMIPRWPSRWNVLYLTVEFSLGRRSHSFPTDGRERTIHRSGNRVDRERPCSAGAAREIILSVDSVRIDSNKNGLIARYARRVASLFQRLGIVTGGSLWIFNFYDTKGFRHSTNSYRKFHPLVKIIF